MDRLVTNVNIRVDSITINTNPEILQRILRKLETLTVDEATALSLLGDINSATSQISVSLEDAAVDITDLMAEVAALPSVPDSVGSALGTLRDTLTAQAARAEQIASAFPVTQTVPPTATPGDTQPA